MDIPSYLLGKQTGGGSAPTLQDKSITITENGITNVIADSGYDGLNEVEITTNVPTGGGGVEEKDVNFIDYDGTIVASYTATEFANLTAMPDNPAHDGLTAQGWNWEFADAKEYVASYGKLWIGQMYITSDGKTRIYIKLEDGRLSPYFGIAVNGSVDVDWGDGSAHDTITNNSFDTIVDRQHVYSSAGDYIIKLTVLTGSARIVSNYYSNTVGSRLLHDNILTSASPTTNIAYQSAIQKVEIGENIDLSYSAFSKCFNLTSVTMPKHITTVANQSFNNCYKLKSITIPNNVSSIAELAFASCLGLTMIAFPASINMSYSCFSKCYNLSSVTIPNSVTVFANTLFENNFSLRNIIIPNSVTKITNGVFTYCCSLTNITIPKNVTNIGSTTFNACAGLGFIKFKPSTPPVVASSNTWSGIPTDCIIYVPSGSLSAYTSATNYPNSSTYTYVEY